MCLKVYLYCPVLTGVIRLYVSTLQLFLYHTILNAGGHAELLPCYHTAATKPLLYSHVFVLFSCGKHCGYVPNDYKTDSSGLTRSCQVEGSRETQPLQVKTSCHKFPVDVSKLVNCTSSYVTNSWLGRNERRGFVFFRASETKKKAKEVGELLLPKRETREGLRSAQALTCERRRLRISHLFLKVRDRWQKLRDKERREDHGTLQQSRRWKWVQKAREQREVTVGRSPNRQTSAGSISRALLYRQVLLCTHLPHKHIHGRTRFRTNNTVFSVDFVISK